MGIIIAEMGYIWNSRKLERSSSRFIRKTGIFLWISSRNNLNFIQVSRDTKRMILIRMGI